MQPFNHPFLLNPIPILLHEPCKIGALPVGGQDWNILSISIHFCPSGAQGRGC